jgi:uncharacterized repeat protein (TIGR01451 family)
MRKIYLLFSLFFSLLSFTSSAQIVANDDVYNDLEGIMGDNSNYVFAPPTLALGNDTLNGNSIGWSNSVILTQLSTTHPNVNLVTTDGGYIIVGAGTPAGTYLINYQICEIANPSNCDTAVITVNVCNLAAPVVSGVIQPSCSTSTGSVLLTGLPATGTWYIHDEDIMYATGSGTSKMITNLSNNDHNFTVTSGGCTSPKVTVAIGYFQLTLNGTYVDFNSDGITNVGDKINYQISVKNLSSCALNNIAVTSSGLTIVGGPLSSLHPNSTNSTTFSASYTITQNDINTGYVDKNIVATGTASTFNAFKPISTRTPLNIENGIKLNAFIDSNSNGTQDLFEQNYSQGTFHYQINQGILHNVVSPTGFVNLYEINVTNSYNLSYTLNSTDSCLYSSNTIYNNVQVPLNSGVTTYNFPINVSPCNDLSIHIINNSAPPRPGFNYTNTIIYTNNGSQTIPNGTITFSKDAALTITSISLTGTISTTNGFTYNFTNLTPNETRTIYVSMQVPTIPNVNLGQVVSNSVSITPIDDFVVNNTSSITQTIVGSYDPNDKQENHGGQIEHATFTSNDYLTYTIQFENTGNANAINVRVNDVLDAKLDETSIRMIDASGDYVLDRIGTILTWKFDGINLPPSVPNTQTGHGYITFEIKPKPGYSIGDIIPNTADIYFDFNPAIITNVCNTEFVATLNNSGFAFTNLNYFPNPVKNTLSISNAAIIDAIEINSVLGQQMLSQKVNSLQTEINLSEFSNGIYFVKVSSQGQEKTIKIMKE